MNRTFKIPPAGKPPSDNERRRIGTVVHDERGNASVSWRDAAADQQRPVLEILGEPKLTVKTEEETFDPYSRHRARSAPGAAPRPRTDLRRLSEWIKMMRDLEARKRGATATATATIEGALRRPGGPASPARQSIPSMSARLRAWLSR